MQKKSTCTLTFKRFLFGGLAAAVLTGCNAATVLSFAAPDASRGGGQIATGEIELKDGMRVRAPFGKCIDTSRVRQADGGASVIIANCSNLGARADLGAPEAAIVLVTIIAGQHGDLGELTQTVRDNPAVLSRSGQAEDVELVSVKASRVAVYANIVDQSPGGPPGLSPRHWKAALDVAGRAVVISVFGKADGPLTGAAGEALIRDTAQAMIESNRATPLPVEDPIQ